MIHVESILYTMSKPSSPLENPGNTLELFHMQWMLAGPAMELEPWLNDAQTIRWGLIGLHGVRLRSN